MGKVLPVVTAHDIPHPLPRYCIAVCDYFCLFVCVISIVYSIDTPAAGDKDNVFVK